jgi:ribosomal protein L13E
VDGAVKAQLAPKGKKQAKDEEKIAAEKTQKVARPPGPVPLATVQSRHGSTMATRAGKGFSMGELAAASIPRNMAGRWKLQVDVRRRSSLEANVDGLRAWAARPAQKTAKVGEVKKLEAEVEKVEKEVVHEVEKEAAKAKKGAKKVEKEVAAAVEKPLKARQRKKKTTKKKQSA